MSKSGKILSTEWLANYRRKHGENSVIETPLKNPRHLMQTIKDETVKAAALPDRKSTREQKLNQTETNFYHMLKKRDFARVRVQAFRLELANNTTYTPDFYALTPAGKIIFFEVKGGYVREDAWVKLKEAARLYPEFEFIKAQYTKESGWKEDLISP